MQKCKHMVQMVTGTSHLVLMKNHNKLNSIKVVNCTYHSTYTVQIHHHTAKVAETHRRTSPVYYENLRNWYCHSYVFKTFHSPDPVAINVSNSFFTGNRARLIILIHPSEPIWVYRTRSSSQITNMTHACRRGRVEERHRATRLLWLEHWKHWNVPKGSIKNVQRTEIHFYVCDSISMQMRNRNRNMTAELCGGNWEKSAVQAEKNVYIQLSKQDDTICATLLLIRSVSLSAPYTAKHGLQDIYRCVFAWEFMYKHEHKEHF